MLNKLRDTFQCFDVRGEFEGASALACGNINDTWRITAREGGSQLDYILQRLNTNVFTDPEAVMRNVVSVVEHHRQTLLNLGSRDIDRRVLTVFQTHGGAHYHIDPDGGFWRCHKFIDGATHRIVTSPEQLYSAAFAFGSFLATLGSLSCPLSETIPGFHNGRLRLAQLERAASVDRLSRLSDAGSLVDFVLERREVMTLVQDLLDAGALPVRVTHNDTKISNVIFERDSAVPLCVIDLDTVMAGSALFDFGDLVRSAANTVNEEENDFALACFDMARFECLHRGYRDAADSILTSAEIEHLADGIKLITLMLVSRYLTDYLNGDVYFKTKDPAHNLRRAMNHINLYRSIERQEDSIRGSIQRH